MIDSKIINVRIDKEIRNWLDNQPRSYNLSEKIRAFIHSEMEKQNHDENKLR